MFKINESLFQLPQSDGQRPEMFNYDIQSTTSEENALGECRMTEETIQDWLTEWSGLDQGQIHSYATVLAHNEELIQALHLVLEANATYSQLQSQICDQLFSYYRSREPLLQNFALQFLPTLMYSYLTSVAAGDKKGCRSVETLLLGIYNLEVVTDTGEPVVFSFRLPSLVQSSIYHEPTRETITDAALRRFEEVNTKPVTWGPHPQTEVINAQNRLKVLTALLFVFNRNIALLHRPSLKNLCRNASKIMTQGFPTRGKKTSVLSASSQKPLPRIPVSSQFLIQLASALYYAMYNDYGYHALEAIIDMYQRGRFECYSDVLVIVNAIKNSSISYVSPTGQPVDAPMGISCAVSPATTTVTTVNKSMITNASFRTKKLPDDIPIVPGGENSATGLADSKQLSSINEDKEEEPSSFTPRGASLRGREAVAKNLQKLGIGKKPKSKTTTSGDKKLKKSPLAHNGDALDGAADSPQTSSKRKSVLENGDGVNGGNTESSGPESLDIIQMDDELRRLDVSPTSNRKGLENEEKPLMQVSSV